MKEKEREREGLEKRLFQEYFSNNERHIVHNLFQLYTNREYIVTLVLHLFMLSGYRNLIINPAYKMDTGNEQVASRLEK